MNNQKDNPVACRRNNARNNIWSILAQHAFDETPLMGFSIVHFKNLSIFGNFSETNFILLNLSSQNFVLLEVSVAFLIHLYDCLFVYWFFPVLRQPNNKVEPDLAFLRSGFLFTRADFSCRIEGDIHTHQPFIRSERLWRWTSALSSSCPSSSCFSLPSHGYHTKSVIPSVGCPWPFNPISMTGQ